MMKSLKERLIQAIDDDEFDVYELLMDMIRLVPEDTLAHYVAEIDLLPEEEEDNV